MAQIYAAAIGAGWRSTLKALFTSLERRRRAQALPAVHDANEMHHLERTLKAATSYPTCPCRGSGPCKFDRKISFVSYHSRAISMNIVRAVAWTLAARRRAKSWAASAANAPAPHSPAALANELSAAPRHKHRTARSSVRTKSPGGSCFRINPLCNHCLLHRDVSNKVNTPATCRRS